MREVLLDFDSLTFRSINHPETSGRRPSGYFKDRATRVSVGGPEPCSADKIGRNFVRLAGRRFHRLAGISLPT